MLKKHLFLLFSISFCVFAQTQTISAQRGRYQLNFDVTYRIGVSRGIQTMIELPGGYTFTGTVIGAGYYVSVSELQNVMYMTKLAEDNFETNVIFHIVTPEGFERRLIMTVFGANTSSAVYAVQFEDPNVSEINAIIREIKARYDEQCAQVLSEQEKSVKRAENKRVLSDVRTMEIKTRRRGRKLLSNKGVKAFVDGIYNSEATSYIRVISNVAHDNCDKLRLIKISQKKNGRECFLFDTYEDERGRTVLIFETSELRPVMRQRKNRRNFNNYKNVRYRFHYKIWDEDVRQRIRIS